MAIMPEYTNEQTKINKIHTTPKKGYKLGTALATWEKIKLATTATTVTNTIKDKEIENGEDSSNRNNFIETGKNGEILIIYPSDNVIEIWDWVPSKHDATVSQSCSGDTLYLDSQYELTTPQMAQGKVNQKKDDKTPEVVQEQSRTIELVKLINGSVNEGYSIAVLVKTSHASSSYALEIHDIRGTPKTKMRQVLSLPNIMQEYTKELEFTLKLCNNFIIVSNNEGFLYLFKLDRGRYFPGNFDLNLSLIKKTSSQPIIDYHQLSKISDAEVVLKTSCFDGDPLFDIVGNWLVYSPTRYEYNHLKVINNIDDKTINNFENKDIDPIATDIDKVYNNPNSIFTPVKLPPPGPLLNRVISTLSNSAIDGLLKISEVSSSKLREYLSKDKEPENNSNSNNKDMVQSLNAFGKTLGKALYSTASNTVSTIQKKTMSLQPNNNQLIKIIDLSNDKIMAIFKPPGGVSNLSLSPFDLQLVHSNYRGDNFFMWDLYRLPKEISLIGKFNRGKTSAIIKDIFWFINHYDSSSIIQGNNLGFGCITKSSGSVHWFNVNYLSGDLDNNFPNNLKKDGRDEHSYNLLSHFLDAWVLSSIGAKKFIALPNIANNINNKFKSNTRYIVNQLAILDSKNQIKIISPLNGSHLFKYELPSVAVSKGIVTEKELYGSTKANTPDEDLGSIIPLSQAEIETCGPYLNLINNKNIKLSTYDFSNSKSDYENFLAQYSEFGNDIPIKEIGFDNQISHNSVFNQFSEGLILDQGQLGPVNQDPAAPAKRPRSEASTPKQLV